MSKQSKYRTKFNKKPDTYKIKTLTLSSNVI